MKLKKGMRLLLDLHTHTQIDLIQIAERKKFSSIRDRTKEQITEDCVKLGIKEYIKQNGLKIAL